MLSPDPHRLWSGVLGSPRHTCEGHLASYSCSLKAECAEEASYALFLQEVVLKLPIPIHDDHLGVPKITPRDW